ncbi:phosphatidylglycerophosphatase B [Sporosarcina sp. NCCP-2716]|uniref:phosphatase PAP2 family protein n=1 Tax=Sporosarcina sp. NCCP-2716 TaxID=2943679 RepID=UPI00203E22E6|nr:phosphatase PAP2 family protein [Sporosarcina sp. NCCP-2716]GKV68500.1 phosphatidylglycerophosphatase B [Sporosarcina sp. NCCP-2716]
MRVLTGRLTAALISCLLLAAVFGYVAYSISSGGIVRFDTAVINAVQGMESPGLTGFMKFFTAVGSTKTVLVICAVTAGTLLYFRQKAQTILFVVVIGGTVAINQVMKLFFHRARPDLHRLIEISGYSFPSGHTMMAASLYAILAFILWRNIRHAGRIVCAFLAFFMVAMICISRIYLGVHYPSDVVGGLCASTFWVVIATSVYADYMKHRASAGKPAASRPQGAGK